MAWRWNCFALEFHRIRLFSLILLTKSTPYYLGIGHRSVWQQLGSLSDHPMGTMPGRKAPEKAADEMKDAVTRN